MKILSWNVNGIRAVERKGFLPWLCEVAPDILCVQETKAHPEQLSHALLAPPGYHAYFASAERKGYSGTLIYSKVKPERVELLGEAKFDCEGRVLLAYYRDFVLINCYFPNSQPERARLDYKLEFNQAIHTLVDRLVAEGRAIVLAGDFNVAHRPIDLARPDDNENSPGYLPEERAWIDHFLGCGYVDSFRHFCAEPGQYSWWSYRSGARNRNIGWRIDYFCINQALVPVLVSAGILPEVQGSDHCPVFIDLALD